MSPFDQLMDACMKRRKEAKTYNLSTPEIKVSTAFYDQLMNDPMLKDIAVFVVSIDEKYSGDTFAGLAYSVDPDLADGFVVEIPQIAEHYNKSEGYPESVTFKPHGYRDVIWCWIVNEPAFFHRLENGEPYCSQCEGWAGDVSHTFIAHIGKPTPDARRKKAAANAPAEPEPSEH